MTSHISLHEAKFERRVKRNPCAHVHVLSFNMTKFIRYCAQIKWVNRAGAFKRSGALKRENLQTRPGERLFPYDPKID